MCMNSTNIRSYYFVHNTLLYKFIQQTRMYSDMMNCRVVCRRRNITAIICRDYIRRVCVYLFFCTEFGS